MYRGIKYLNYSHTLTRLHIQSFHHIPVLQKEVINNIYPTNNIMCMSAASARGSGVNANELTFIDGTVGGGGHSELILQKFPNCNLLCIDRDVEALITAKKKLSIYDNNNNNRSNNNSKISFCHGSYKDLQDFLQISNFP